MTSGRWIRARGDSCEWRGGSLRYHQQGNLTDQVAALRLFNRGGCTQFNKLLADRPAAFEMPLYFQPVYITFLFCA